MQPAGHEPSPRTHKGRLTALLWAINLSSITASVLVYIYLSYYAYKALGSVLLSEFVLFAPMVMPVLFAFQINRIASGFEARKVLLGANALGLVSCLVIFPLLDFHSSLPLIGAAVIGTIDALQRVTRIVVIKQYFSANEVKFTIPLTLTAQFIAGGLAGAVLAFFPGQITSFIATMATTVLFALACLGATLLPLRPPQPAAAVGQARSLARFLQLVRDNQELQRGLINFVLLSTFFQGFYNISRVVLPAHHLGLAQHHVGLLQIVASSAALAGALFFYFFSKKKLRFHPPWLYAGCATAMLASCLVPSPFESFALYFVYFFIFELAFFRLQADIVAASPSNEMPLIATVQYALVYTGMMAAIFVGAYVVKSFGLTAAAVTLLAGFVLSHLAFWIFSRRSAIDPKEACTSQEPI